MFQLISRTASSNDKATKGNCKPIYSTIQLLEDLLICHYGPPSSFCGNPTTAPCEMNPKKTSLLIMILHNAVKLNYCPNMAAHILAPVSTQIKDQSCGRQRLHNSRHLVHFGRNHRINYPFHSLKAFLLRRYRVIKWDGPFVDILQPLHLVNPLLLMTTPFIDCWLPKQNLTLKIAVCI